MNRKFWLWSAAIAFVVGCASQEAPAPAPAPAPQPAPAPAAPAAPKPAPEAAKPKPVAEKVTFAADVLFDFDSAAIKPDGKAKLDDLANKMKGMNLEVVIAIGHTDSIGSEAYNLKLSERRARKVAAELAARSVPPEQTKVEWFGETHPRVPTADGAREAQNRRVEVVFQ